MKMSAIYALHSTQERLVYHTASGTRTSISGLLGLFSVSSAEVVSAGVDDDSALQIFLIVSFVFLLSLRKGGSTYAENAVFSNKLDQLILNGANGVTLGISADVAQVTDMALVISWSTVSLGERVDCISSAHSVFLPPKRPGHASMDIQ